MLSRLNRSSVHLISNILKRAFYPAKVDDNNTMLNNNSSNNTMLNNNMLNNNMVDNTLSDNMKPTNKSISFDNTIITYKHKNFIDLTLALIILKICNYPMIVNNAEWMINLSKKYIGNKITLTILQYTIFKHFCAGVDEISTSDIINKLQLLGVGSILDYAAEADINTTNNNVIENEENACDMNTNFILHSIDTASKTISKLDRFAAMKITAIARTSLLEKYSSVQDSIKKLFKTFDLNNDGKISKEEFYQVSDKLSVDVKNLFSTIDTKGVGYIDITSWENYFDSHTCSIGSNSFFSATFKNSTTPLLESLDAEEVRYLDIVKARLEKLAISSSEKDVILMVDAEQTYFQAAIDSLALNCQRKFNKSKVVIANTFHVDTLSRLQLDLDRANKEGWVFGAKLVRGAYMVSERERAKQLGYEDPIQPNIESTHKSYHACVIAVLDNIDNARVMVASHNEETVEFVVKEMTTRNWSKDRLDRVYFAQLYGMGEHLTFTLGANGFKAYKYLPFGPVSEVIPYLLRRSIENASFLGGAVKERQMLWNEYKRRYLPFQ